eukprot:gnl/Hemi2/21659_TR7218_c0_g1_i1.p1 gnl/Hemi2/21659_TR7218_c0_g1~~gnl/Hemi2/21659_TR7218_c0_g1_i1.p1  ORF type:complete len:504 (+),score=108.77 gnl/Hemi2/21659_TR7218_c0_g1_i1:84-1595(+)
MEHDVRRKVAFVVGNSKYIPEGLDLPKCADDADAMSDCLISLGFVTQKFTNLECKQMKDQWDKFVGLVETGDVVVVYFSGHGMEQGGINYLLCVDADFPLDLSKHSVSFSYMQQNLNQKANTTNIIILDCCRENPLDKTFKSFTPGKKKTVSQGLAHPEARREGASAEFLFAYACDPGTVARADEDSESPNSPFTASLLKKMTRPHRTVHDLLHRVTRDVHRNTGGQQVPWQSSNFRLRRRPFSFVALASGEESEDSEAEQPDGNEGQVYSSGDALIEEADGGFKLFEDHHQHTHHSDHYPDWTTTPTVTEQQIYHPPLTHSFEVTAADLPAPPPPAHGPHRPYALRSESVVVNIPSRLNAGGDDKSATQPAGGGHLQKTFQWEEGCGCFCFNGLWGAGNFLLGLQNFCCGCFEPPRKKWQGWLVAILAFPLLLVVGLVVTWLAMFDCCYYVFFKLFCCKLGCNFQRMGFREGDSTQPQWTPGGCCETLSSACDHEAWTCADP